MKFFYYFIFLLLLPSFAHSQAGKWTWVKGDSAANSKGHFGNVGVPSPLNEPPSRYDGASWTDTAGNFWIYSGYNAPEDMWKFDPNTSEWTWMSGDSLDNNMRTGTPIGQYSAANSPGGIDYGPYTWVTPDNHFWLFGGPSNGILWQYDPAINQWANMGNFYYTNYGTLGQGSTSTSPGDRYGSNVAWTDTLGNLWLFGGYNGSYDYGDVWKYNIATNIWTWMSGSNQAEGQGVYGTKGVPSVNNYPPAALTNFYWLDDAGNLWLVGGTMHTYSKAYNDIWKFNPNTLEWTWVDGPGVPTYQGPANTVCQDYDTNYAGTKYDNQAVWKICDNLVLNYGGYNAPYREFLWNGLWRFSPGDSIWEKLSDAPAGGHYTAQGMSAPLDYPRARRGPVAFKDRNNNLWMMGGADLNLDNFYNDLWKYTLDTTCLGASYCGITTASGCNLSKPVLTAAHDSICLLDSTSICATAGYAAYEWSTGDTGTCIEVYGYGIYQVTAADAYGCSASSNPLQITSVAVPPVTLHNTGNVVCVGVTVDICVISGEEPVMWWNNGDSVHGCLRVDTPGNYFVFAANSMGCVTESDSVVITGVQPVNIDAISDTVCLGDSVRICAPYGYANYFWSNGSYNDCTYAKATGSYYVTVIDFSGCNIISDPAVIQGIEPMELGVTATPPVLCGIATSKICAAAGFTSYGWNIGTTTAQCVNTDVAGTYTVSAIDQNGCSTNNSVNIISVQPPAQPLLNIMEDTLCLGEKGQICTQLTYTQYYWNDGETGQCAEALGGRQYNVMITDGNNCTAVSNNARIPLDTFSVFLPVYDGNICYGEQICASGNYNSYLWSNSDTGQCARIKATGNYSVTATDYRGCGAVSDTVAYTLYVQPLLTLSTLSDTICQGDTALVCATPGFLYYVWNFSGVRSTSNCFEVTNNSYITASAHTSNGCNTESNEVYITVEQPYTVLINTTGYQAFCSNDSIEICAPEGYKTYLWNNNGNSSCTEAKTTGAYNVSVTDAYNCPGTSGNFYLEQLPPLIVSINATADSVCNGDSIAICVQAPGSKRYLWNTNDSTQCIYAKASGNYFATVVDSSGCSAQSDSVNVNIIQPVVTIAAAPDTICSGDSTQICAPQGYALYLWSTGISAPCLEVAATGNYYLKVTDNNGCTALSNQVAITQVQPQLIDILQSGDTLRVNGGTHIQWYLNDTAISNAIQNTYIAPIRGSYSVSVTDNNGCPSFSSPIIYTGISYINADESISIYPNPLAVGSWQLAVGNEYIGAQVEILDDDGMVVYKSEIRNLHSEIPAQFGGGIYLLRITSGSMVVARKLVKL